MTPPARARWRIRPGALPAWLAILALMLLACTAGCAGEPGNKAAANSVAHPATHPAIHLLQAQLLSVPGDGFSPPPVNPPKEILAAHGWETVALPHKARRHVVGPYGPRRTVTDWYKLDLSSLPASAEPAYLYIPRWKTIGQLAIYADGKLLYQSEGSLVYNDYNHPLLLRLNGAAGVPVPASVLLRIDRLQSSGSALSTVWAGPAAELVWRYQWRTFFQNQLPFAGVSAFLAMGVFSLVIWFKRRHESLYLLFFIISAAAFLRMQHYYVGGNYLPLSDEWLQWLTVSSLMWLVVLVNNFMERLHKRPLRWLTPTLVAVTLALNLLTLPGAAALLPDLVLITPLLYLLMLPFAVLISVDALRNALRTRSRDVWLMAGWFVATIVLSAYDLALQNNWVGPEGVYTNPYGVVGLFVMFGYIMFGRYVGAIGEVERVNAGLAQRLQDREAELAASYERMSKIEQRQTLSDERQRLMQDMHDGLGSTLISAIRSVEQGGMSDRKVSQILKDCMDDLKLTIDSMEPVEADLLLLLATLRFRLEPRLEGTDVRLLWEVRELPTLDWLDPSSALHILRIVQESVANILRHTRATEIRVGTASVPGGVEVIIEDNGQGFDVEKALGEAAGRGLHNQRRRAESIGGRVDWLSGPAGTRLTLWLPIRREG